MVEEVGMFVLLLGRELVTGPAAAVVDSARPPAEHVYLETSRTGSGPCISG